MRARTVLLGDAPGPHGNGRHLRAGGHPQQPGPAAPISQHDRPPYVPTNIVEYMYEVCYGNFSTDYPGLACECSGVDVELYTGRVQCNTTSYCMEEQSFPCNATKTFCGTASFSYDITAPYTGSFAECMYYTQPAVLSSCYGYTLNGVPDQSSCTFQINGTACTACGFADYDYLQDGNITTCTVYDCNNTILPGSGYFCYIDLPSRVFAYRFASDPLPCEDGCNLCGEDGYVTNYGNVTLPGYGDVPCFYISYLAEIGRVPPDQCGPLGEAIFSECGCMTMGGTGGATPAPSGGTGGGALPTAAPIAVVPPTAAPGGGGGGVAPAPTAVPGAEVSPTAAPSGETASSAPLGAAAGMGGLVMAATAAATAVAAAAVAGLG